MKKLIWLLLTFGWGMGVMAYIACVIALPEEAPAQPEQPAQEVQIEEPAPQKYEGGNS